MSEQFYIGLMSGTSLDGVDGVVVDLSQQQPHVLAAHSQPLPAALRQELLTLNHSGPDELHRAAVASHQLAHQYAQVVHSLLQQTGLPAQAIRALGAHGQTVRHHPPGAVLRQQTVDPTRLDFPPYTLQLNQPALLAELTHITVVADFRSRDIAAGGQGAPLVPAFHRHVFGRPAQATAVVNIGGMANITALSAQGTVHGLDSGPGNVLLDLWCERHTGQTYDADGRWAAQGKVHTELLRHLLNEPYFHQTGIKSTGRDLFNPHWLEQRLQGYTQTRPVDVQATLVALTARSITRALQAQAWGGQWPKEVLVCGGGAYNACLMAALQQALPQSQVLSTAARGWPVMQVEAAAFAWLAQRAMEGLPGNEPQVTGASGPRVLGAIYPA